MHKPIVEQYPLAYIKWFSDVRAPIYFQLKCKNCNVLLKGQILRSLVQEYFQGNSVIPITLEKIHLDKLNFFSA